MKRLLLPASALILVVTACGAGVKPAPRVAEIGARLPKVVDRSIRASFVRRLQGLLGVPLVQTYR
jgi:hypothetical protein